MYVVYIENAAQKDLNHLPRDRFKQIIAEIKMLANNPRPAGCRKIAGSKSDWRIRVGPYRVIYEVDDKSKVVKVMVVRHRREAYR